jgi:hypothetical protein
MHHIVIDEDPIDMTTKKGNINRLDEQTIDKKEVIHALTISKMGSHLDDRFIDLFICSLKEVYRDLEIAYISSLCIPIIFRICERTGFLEERYDGNEIKSEVLRKMGILGKHQNVPNKKTGKLPYNTSIWIFPINYDEHWSLLVMFSGKMDCFFHYDSLKNRNIKYAREFVNLLKSLKIVRENVPFISPNIRWQKTDWTCGYFLCWFVYTVLHSNGPILDTYDISEEQIVNKIKDCMNELNK